MSKRQKQTKAFTLIELLVVIAIIALLLSILVPSLKKAKEYAKDVICFSNLRQWNLCWKTYLNDNEDKFVIIKEQAGVTSAWHEWIYKLLPYFQNDGIFTCASAAKTEYDPSSPTGAITVGSYMGTINGCWKVVPDLNVTPGQQVHFGSYGLNYWVSNQQVSLGTTMPKENFWKSDGSIKVSGRSIPLFTDSVWTGLGPMDADIPRTEQVPSTPSGWNVGDSMNRALLPRHGGGKYTEIVFLDGSARKVGMRSMWTLKWHSQFDTVASSTRAWPEWIKSSPE